ncbi:MICOS complex subunit mic60 [Cladophialophora chaetospira]|uniref:MICOS complex subunit MIC60 n=1 Tax=Cladophialophora chaetospira TaxID=386627 RepID=A0AA38X3G4_9EURO|nr:MICOS complex subunit mic60 [Cladophialophora chaetospira]
MLRLARPISAPLRRQLVAQAGLSQRRAFAERSDAVLSSDPAFLPGSQSKAAPVKTEVPLGPGGPGAPAPKPTDATPATPSSNTTIPPQKAPLAPPNPPVKTQTAPPTTSSTVSPPGPPPPPPSSQPPPPPPRKRFSRFRLLLYLIGLSGLTYGGAIFYALRNDNFHDFFTEYVPFGEESVLYFEERAFKKRFPSARHNVTRPSRPEVRGEDKVTTIPQKSGLSWRAVEEPGKGSDVTQKGKHMSAVSGNAPVTAKDAADAKQDPTGATRKEKSVSVETAKKNAAAKQDGKPKETSSASVAKPVDTSPQPPSPPPAATTPPSTTDTRPPAIPPVSQISPLKVANADEPVVQELVKIVNDLITVVNSDSADAANKYSQPMNKAKESLEQVAGKISTLRDAERQAAEERVAQAHKEFDEGAKQLLERIQTAQAEDDARYREEFEAEKARIARIYDEKVKTEVQRSTELAEQRMRNELAEQAIEMKRDFVKQVKDLVESEREGRLSKLTDLSTNVDSLTELTSNWNGVIDSNLATQKLQVAVDAVRSSLASSAASDAKPRAFVREMAALKLVAEGDPIVDAAIASINPAAYQKGIPSPPQLIDRFRRVASEVRKASLLPEDAGVASHAASFILSNVLFKKRGQPTGGDVESVLTRTETLLEEGDLDGAAREMNSLQGWAKVLSRDWLGDVRKVLEVKQALEVIETEARLQCLRVG